MIPTYFVSAVYFPVPVHVRLRWLPSSCVCLVSVAFALVSGRFRLAGFGSVCVGFRPVASVLFRLRLRWLPSSSICCGSAPSALVSVPMRPSSFGSVCVDFCPDASVLSRLRLR